MSCGIGRRHSSDPKLLWLWCRLAAAAPIQPIAWELQIAMGAPLHPKKRKSKNRSSHCGAAEMNPTRNHEVPGLISGLAQWIWCCRELQCRLQMQLGSCVAVAVVQASSYSSDLTPSLGTSICHGCGPKKTRKKIF